ncbi:MAG: adenylate cyclase [Verrucomicrobiales bacterium]|jgi:adenylate cyclase
MRDSLHDLLLEYSQAPDVERRAELESEIWTRFGCEKTVLIWDMSGFSLLTRRHGIVHYLSIVRRMHETTRPIVDRYDGLIVKFEADNGYVVFPSPLKAVQAALAINVAFEIENARFPEDFDIHVSCGIDHGKILLIDDKDFFGETVNTASKLGEDLAGAGEILVTKSAMALIPESAGLSGKPVNFSISGLELSAVSMKPA